MTVDNSSSDDGHGRHAISCLFDRRRGGTERRGFDGTADVVIYHALEREVSIIVRVLLVVLLTATIV